MAGLVTLFGGSGFLGRYVARELLRRGARVRFAGRDPKHAWQLKPQGGLGQCQFVAADIRMPGTVARAVSGADAVINLVGVLSGDFQGLHLTGARNVAEASAAAGVGAMVQVSAIGADPASSSRYGRTKGEGEQAVCAAFPQATIVRPSIIFGQEDQFINRFARMAELLPILPVIRGSARFQPVFAGDVAQAIASAALAPGTFGGRTFELGGPEVMSMTDINAYVSAATGRRRGLLEIPDGVAALMAKLGGWLPGAPITQDQWLMLQSDNVVSEGADDFGAFGVTPKPLDVIAPSYLVRFRRLGRFAADVEPIR